MRAYLTPLCQLAPFVGLALLGIFGLIDSTIMIVLAIVLVTGSSARSCWPARRA
jgi:hypothetical protein